MVYPFLIVWTTKASVVRVEGGAVTLLKVYLMTAAERLELVGMDTSTVLPDTDWIVADFMLLATNMKQLVNWVSLKAVGNTTLSWSLGCRVWDVVNCMVPTDELERELRLVEKVTWERVAAVTPVTIAEHLSICLKLESVDTMSIGPIGSSVGGFVISCILNWNCEDVAAEKRFVTLMSSASRGQLIPDTVLVPLLQYMPVLSTVVFWTRSFYQWLGNII